MTTSLDKQYSALPSRSNLHLTRKFWHVGMGLFGVWLVYLLNLSQKEVAILLLVVAILGLTVDLLRINNPKINEHAIKIFGPFMRKSEVYSFSGIPFFAFGTSLSLFLFPRDLAILSILFLIFSDPISSVVGILYGKDKFLPNKSVQGSLAGFVTCFVLSLVYTLSYHDFSFTVVLFCLSAGVIGSLSEMASVIVDDNLTIPLISGLGLTVLNLVFNFF